MPGDFPKHLLELHPSAVRRNKTALHRNGLVAQTGAIVLCLGLASASMLYAQAPGVSPAPALPLEPGIVPSPLTFEQNLGINIPLGKSAETKSQANALYAQAMCSNVADKPLEILSELRQVIALDLHFAEAQVKLANLLLQLGQSQAAVDQLRVATASNPDSIDIKASLAYALRVRGQTDEALRLSKSVLVKDPTQAMAMRVLLEIKGEQNDLAGGVLHIEDILKADDAHAPASAWLTLARLYVEVARGTPQPPMGEALLKTLLPIYQQAASKPPPEVETLSLLADTYRDLGRPRDALKALQQASALDPSDVDVILRCAELLSALGSKADALKNYERAYALNPGLTGLREILGHLYLDNGRFEDAARLLKEALADSPNDPELIIDLGIAYEGAHELEQAKACFQQVFAIDSCPPEVYLKLAVFQLARSRLDDATATLATAQGRFPKSAKVRFYQAILLRYQKKYVEALDCLEQVRSLATGTEADALDINYYSESALTMNLAGKKDRIESTLLEGMAKYPDSPEIMNELGYFWADSGTHLPQALALSRRATEREPDNGAYEDTRGWVYFQMGKTKDALPHLQRAALLTNNDPVVLQHLGDAYLKLGLKSEALAAWRTGLQKDPRNGDLANRIDAILAQATHAHTSSAPQH